MATTYTQMVDKVLSWSNRDIEVLPYATIKDFINFAVDDAYRMLRVPPLEHVAEYSTINTHDVLDAQREGVSALVVPPDLIEFIQLRKKTGVPTCPYQIYTAKSDIRSFFDPFVDKYDYYYYTRERNNILIHPHFVDSDQFELYYYRRLPEIDARYDGISLTSARAGHRNFYYADTEATLMQIVRDSETQDVFIKDPELTGRIHKYSDSDYGLGKLAPNWLRDENEKIILYGALGQAFDYLNEPENAQKYMQRFREEIEELNREDKMRMSRGGNVQQHFVTYDQI